MLRFVPNDTQGMPQRRSQARACEICRRRKKRCDHSSDFGTSNASEMRQGYGSSKRARISVPSNAAADVQSNTDGLRPLISGIEQSQNQPLVQNEADVSATTVSPVFVGTPLDSGAERSSTAAGSGSHPNTYDSSESRNESRFIGHLNPEGTFLVAASPANNRVSGQPEEIGIWLSAKSQNGTSEHHPAFPMRKAQAGVPYCPNPVVAELLLPHLEGSCLSLLPDPTDFDALCNIYFDEFHPMFPILDRQNLEAPQSHAFSRIVVRQIICLIASSSSSAEPHLSLTTNEARSTLTRSDFARQLSLAVRTILNLELIKDKLTLCQICALFSMYTQLADDRHLSIEFCARAVALSLTLGIHLPNRADQPETKSLQRVFCCIWALDRLNAAFQGRPVTMHERDIGIDLRATFASQEGCFRLFLHTTLLLDNVIDLYRPKADGSEADWGPDFPDFESIIHEADALRLQHNLLATVEICYHAVAMLSCRSQSLHQPLRRSPSYLRQSLSAHRVLSIVSEELKPKLSPTPIVPYAVSLALRFFYREFRYTKVSLFRTRAQKQLILGYSILESLGEAFPAAAGIAEMVKQTLKETEKAYSSMVQPEEPERARTSGETESAVVPGTINVDLEGGQQRVSEWTWDADNLMWNNMPDIDIFQHFDPNFNLDAIDAALADDTQPVFPITFENLWS